MAFTSTAGYTNLPNGVFSATIFSKKAQIKFRKTAVVQAITNSDYFGEISQYGDTVRIIKEPTVTVSAYTRGKALVRQDLSDEELTLTIDKANYFDFAIDDIEKKQSHVNWEDMAANNAAYQMRDVMDKEVLAHIRTSVPSGQVLGNTTAVTIGFGSGQMTPLAVMNRIKRLMQAANIPTESRWAVVDPIFSELLESEDSKLINRDFGDNDILRNGKVTAGLIRGFSLHESNNLPIAGAGPEGATAGTDFGYLLFGHKSAVATAEQIDKVEKYRPQDTFADAVKGLHLYGRKVLRTEAVFAVKYRVG